MINPNGIYREKFNLREFECDQKYQLRVSNILRYMQQVCSTHLESLGIGYQLLLEQDMVFLLSSLHLKINRRPRGDEEIIISTCPLDPKGARFFRNTTISNNQGEILAEADTCWLLVSPTTRKIHRPSAFPYQLKTGTLEDDSFLKLKLPEMAFAGQRKVVESDIDINGHMNNARYADIALDFLPYEVVSKKEVESVNLHFKHEALIGENLEISIANSTDKVYYVNGCTDNIEKFAAEITFKD